MNMTVVIGPHSMRSGFDGVIQFTNMDKALIKTAADAVHDGQFGQPPSTECKAKIIAQSSTIEAIAAKRRDQGNAPSI